ncbi:MAG: hypothetical protein RL115_2120 [Bacteroidota bacterium]|jgi:hypothetical protein
MKKLERSEMKNLKGGDDEVLPGDDGCLKSGSVCKKNEVCCSKSCGDKDANGIRYCDGA